MWLGLTNLLALRCCPTEALAGVRAGEGGNQREEVDSGSGPQGQPQGQPPHREEPKFVQA